jgi:phospholipid transport system transporter-binding protein
MASIALPEQLTMAEARSALDRLRAAIEADPAPRIDASALASLDSSAIALLLECRRIAAAQRKTLPIDAMPAKLGDLARLYGVAELLVPATAA